ncbi:Plastidial pyruvate kinase 2 [Vitis vinifera]|uniref:Pyruvate kinase n=1 Tax=Vitis vinifera TaxID=29760 RepID=A0A438ICU1_VITVI|nr:Plastidial pyruvate kinase 2 [Vitis vinifera]
MAQVVATRAIQSSILCPSSGSVHERFEKLKPSGFAAKVLAREERRSRRVAWRGGPIAAAKRSVGAEMEVVPVTPEDAKVCDGIARKWRIRSGNVILKRKACGDWERNTYLTGFLLLYADQGEEQYHRLRGIQQLGETSVGMWSKPTVRRKTKIVCTIGPSTNTREMIWKLAEAGMNVARLNMSHGDHASHQKVIDLVKEYNAQSKDNVIAIMLDTKASFLVVLCPTYILCCCIHGSLLTCQLSCLLPFLCYQGPEVRSGDLPQPIMLKSGQEFTFTIQRGVGTADCVSVNYDDFVNDVEMGDMLLVDGGMMSLMVKSKTGDSVKCEVVDGGELKSRRHLNVRGKSATLPSITEKDWDDIKFGVDNKVDFYAVSFVKDAKVVHELKNYLKSCNADIHVIVKIESADSIPNLHSIITASDGAMVARGDLGAELPIEEVPLLQEEIIRICRSMGKAVIVATNMLESMIVHPTPTRAEVSDIAIAVREGADAVMLSGETAHGKFPLKAVKVMHTVSLRTEATLVGSPMPPNLGQAFKNHMSEMFAFHATMMSNTLGTSIVVFTRTGFMAILLSHYRPSGTIFAFTNEERVQQRLAVYQGVCPIYMQFSDDAEETFANALSLLQKQGMVKEGEEVALVQSGRQPIWRFQSTHNIQVRKV